MFYIFVYSEHKVISDKYSSFLGELCCIEQAKSALCTRKCGATNWTEFQRQQKPWLENSSPGFTGPALLL